MKVLIVFNHPAPYKINFFNELSKHIDLDVIFERIKERDRSKLFYSEKKCDFNVISIKGISFGNENYFSNGIIKHIKHNQYDLIIMNGYSTLAEMKTIRYLNKHHIKYVLYINGGIINFNEPKWKKKLKTKYISSASYYFSPDKRSNDYLIYYGANPNNILNYPYSTIHEKEILTNPLSIEEKKKRRIENGIECKNLFVSCGQLIKRKNYFELIKVWKNIDKDNLLIIIGDGKEENKYLKYIKDNDIKNVKITGFLPRKQIFNLYQISDVFVFSSNEDIYGHVINEALSQGLPVISTPNVNASQHLIKDGINGYIVNNIDSDDFRQKIKDILLLDTYNECIKTAKENTYELMAKQFIQMLEGVLKR